MAYQQKLHCEKVMSAEESVLPRVSEQGNYSRVVTAESTAMKYEEMLKLRKQLQTEAENIVRWKASTEVKTKNLERELQEKQSIVDDQRSNLMELQLHSEHLSQNLFKERQERELVHAKVSHTRQLFLALQEQYGHLFVSVSQFQQDNAVITKEHADVIAKLIDLQESFAQQQSSVEQMIAKDQENVCTLKKLKDAHLQTLMDKGEEIKDLNGQLKCLKDNVKSLSDDLSATAVNLSSLESEKVQLCTELCEVKASLVKAEENFKEQLEMLTSQVTRANEEFSIEHDRLEERTREFQEAVEKIQILKKANDTLEGAKSELTEKVSALSTRKQELEEEILCRGNIILSLESAQSKALTETHQLQQRIADLNSQISMIEAEKNSTELKNINLATELKSFQEKFSREEQLLQQLKEQVVSQQDVIESSNKLVTQLEGQNASKETSIQQLEHSIKTVKEKLVEKEEAIMKMEEKTVLLEELGVKLGEERKHREDELNKSSSELKKKEQECEDLSDMVKQLKADIKKIEKEHKSVTKNVATENKIKKKLEQKITGLENKLEKSLENCKQMEKELQEKKTLLDEKLKKIEELTVTLDETICGKQEAQSRFEAKDESFQSYQAVTNASLEALQTELDHAKDVLNITQSEHVKEIQQLQEQLEQAKEAMSAATATHEQQLQEASKLCHEKHEATCAEYESEVSALKAKTTSMMTELEQAKQEANVAVKEKLQTKLESDDKVKEMVELLDRYKSDKEAKLKVAEEELQAIKTQISQLTKEKDDLLAENKDLKSEAAEKRKTPVTQATGINTPTNLVTVLSTPSPSEYMSYLTQFAEPKVPPTPKISKGASEAGKSQQGKQQLSGILKSSRRTLLPPEYQKRVVFKTSTFTHDLTSGDSSSDACAFEVADSDDPFEEMKKPKRCIVSSRAGQVPRANIAPFILKTQTSSSKNPTVQSYLEQKPAESNGKDITAVPLPPKKKRARNEHLKQTLKTYSAVSPKNKTV